MDDTEFVWYVIGWMQDVFGNCAASTCPWLHEVIITVACSAAAEPLLGMQVRCLGQDECDHLRVGDTELVQHRNFFGLVATLPATAVSLCTIRAE